MEPNEWLGCDLLESLPGKVSGAVVFKDTRLPVETITDNVDAYMELCSQSLDEAIASTLESFPDTPGGADAIRQVLAYRQAAQTRSGKFLLIARRTNTSFSLEGFV